MIETPETPSDKKMQVSVDTFINYKDESLAQHVQIGEEVTNTVMRVREEQTVEALKMLGWFPPGEIPPFSDASCLAAQDVYNVTPVIFGDRAHRMRAALIAAMSQHCEEMRHAVEKRAEELEQKFAPKPAVEAIPEPPAPVALYVSPDGSWRTSLNEEGDLQAWFRDHDDHAVLNIPQGADDELCETVAALFNTGATQAMIDGAIFDWVTGP